MSLNAKEFAQLRRIILLAQKMIAESPKPKRGRPTLSNGNGLGVGQSFKRTRRTGKKLAAFRKMLIAG